MWLCLAGPHRKAAMDQEPLRLLIRAKLEQGLLPYDSIPRVWGAPGSGETCDACDLVIEPPQMVIEGIALSNGNSPLHAPDLRGPLQLHVMCFYLWDVERRS